jgi:hypothetical protein
MPVGVLGAYFDLHHKLKPLSTSVTVVTTYIINYSSEDGVVVLRFGGLEVGPFLIEVTFGGGDVLRKMFAD